MMKKTLGVLLPLAAAMSFVLPASAAVSELSAEEAAIYRTQMDANIQAVKQQQEQIEAEARARALVKAREEMEEKRLRGLSYDEERRRIEDDISMRAVADNDTCLACEG